MVGTNAVWPYPRRGRPTLRRHSHARQRSALLPGLMAALALGAGCARERPVLVPCAWRLAPSPDGRFIAFAAQLHLLTGSARRQPGHPIFVLDVTEGEVVVETHLPPDGNDFYPRWHASEHRLLFVRGPAAGAGRQWELVELSVPGGEERPLGLALGASLLLPSRWLWRGRPGEEPIFVRVWGSGRPGSLASGIYKAAIEGGQWSLTPVALDDGPDSGLIKFWLPEADQAGEVQMVALSVWGSGAESKWAVCVVETDEGKVRQVGPTFGQCYGTDVSPDGSLFAAVERRGTDKQARVIDIGKPDTSRTMALPKDVSFLRWSPAGTHLLAWGGGQKSRGSRLWLIDPMGDSQRQIGNDEWYPSAATWLPNGNEVVVAAEAALWVVEIDTGDKRKLWEFPPEYQRQYE